MTSDIFPIVVPCCTSNEDCCLCGAEERVLRAYIRSLDAIAPMNPEQRNWCLNEIDRIEGYDHRDDYAQFSDADLASTVLSAWTDYCRDKGLL